MSSAKSVVETLVFDTLNDGLVDVGVYQDAPIDAPYPLVIVGDLRSSRLPGKAASADRSVTVSIIAMVEADERAPLLALQERIEELLDGQSFYTTGWSVVFQFEDDDAVLGEDGATYSGVSAFTALALAD